MPALKRQKSKPSGQRALGPAAVSESSSPQRSRAREQQHLIEGTYSDREPFVPALPGVVKIGVLAAGVGLSWLAVMAAVLFF